MTSISKPYTLHVKSACWIAVLTACLSLAPSVGAAQPSMGWESIGPYFEPTQFGAVNALAFIPDTSSIYIATPAGVFKSAANSGWERTYRGLGLQSSQVQAILGDPSSPDTVYAGTCGAGVFRTTNGGRSWHEANYGLTNLCIQVIAKGPGPGSAVYVGTRGQIFKTIDHGESWIDLGLTNVSVTALALDPSNPSTVYLGTYGQGVLRSTDGGMTWMSTGLRTEGDAAYPGIYAITVDPVSPNVVYAGAYRRTFRSLDAGVSWSPLGGRPSDSSGAIALAVDPRSLTLYAVDPKGVWRSSDRGETWVESESGSAASLTSGFVISQDSPSIYFASQSLGLAETTDGTLTWHSLTHGFFPATVTRLAGLERPSLIYATAGTPFGSFLYKSSDRGDTWVNISGGIHLYPSLPLAIDPENDETVYVATEALGISKTTDAGASWSPVNEGLPLSTSTGTLFEALSIAIDPTLPTTVYAGISGSGVYKSTDAGQHWSATAPLPPSRFNPAFQTDATDLRIDPTGPANVYAATELGVFKSTDGGSEWQLVYPVLADHSITRIVLDPSVPSTVYGGTVDAVVKSTDAGSTWAVLTDGLPLLDAEVSSLAIDPASSLTVFAGFYGRGLFQSVDGGAHWLQASPPGGINWGSDVLIVDSRAGPTVYVGDSVGGALYRSAPPVERTFPRALLPR